MREIKFRVVLNNEIVGEEVFVGGKWKSQFYSANPDNGVRWVNGVLDIEGERNQYTGLKDKNGKEIYEGDIVNCHGYYIGDSWINSNNGTVKYDNGSFYVDYEFAPDLCREEISNCNISIQGNIHENPELKESSKCGK